VLNYSNGGLYIYFISPWAAIVKNIKAEKYKHTKTETRKSKRTNTIKKTKKHYRTKLLINPFITAVNTLLSNSLSMNFFRRLSITLHNDERPREFLKNTMSSPSLYETVPLACE